MGIAMMFYKSSKLRRVQEETYTPFHRMVDAWNIADFGAGPPGSVALPGTYMCSFWRAFATRVLN